MPFAVALLSSYLAFVTGSAFANSDIVCTNLKVRSDVELRFSDTEKRFLCGDSHNEAWSEAPENQIKIFLIAFLQARGYFQPEFSREGTVLVVDVGEKSRIRILSSQGMPEELDFSRFWVPARKPLTPALLDEYRDLVHSRIGSEGYPSPIVKVTANAAEGSMDIVAAPGPRQKITSIKEEEVLGLKPGTLRRYYPIEEGDWFDSDLVYITNQRIKAEDILSSSYMVSRSGKEGAEIEHHAAAGPPRRMRVGFGVNTETYFLFRTNYRNARVDSNASRFDAVLSANYFKQRLESSFDWYFLTEPSAFHFKPAISFERQFERSSEVRTTTVSWHLGTYRDGFGHQWHAYIGPNLHLVRTPRGDGPTFARIFEFETNGRLMSHDYEFYQGAPRTGHRLAWRYTNASKNSWSSLNVKTISVNGDRLFNWARLEPPLLVLGIRGGAQTTYADNDQEIPDQYLYYLGGSNDVRGFARRTIPSLNTGARSAAYLGTEARLVTILPHELQPFIFLDAGKVGGGNFTFERPVFWSPGIGLRWQSPVGSLRGNLARGFIKEQDPDEPLNVKTELTAYVSFGEEF